MRMNAAITAHGTPCLAAGHTLRYRNGTGNCVECYRTPEKLAANSRWRKANPDKQRRYKGHPEPSRLCPTACECCGILQTQKSRQFSLDHCHTTGAFRGWLCDNCNTGIGKLGDTVSGLRKAIAYLEWSAAQ